MLVVVSSGAVFGNACRSFKSVFIHKPTKLFSVHSVPSGINIPRNKVAFPFGSAAMICCHCCVSVWVLCLGSSVQFLGKWLHYIIKSCHDFILNPPAYYGRVIVILMNHFFKLIFCGSEKFLSFIIWIFVCSAAAD